MTYKKLAAIAASISLLFLAMPALANHSWNGYHWARTSNPLILNLGDNLSPNWDSYLASVSNDWNVSTVLDTSVVAGQSKGNCRPTAGRVEICNKSYGNNGWLGLAQIWASGKHITQGTVKVNDTYFFTAKYNTSAWKNLVLCQEVGHIFGLDHQDEIFDNPNLGTCMDYTNDPSTNQHPNQHDYEELELIYNHLDSNNTAFQPLEGGKAAELDAELNNPSAWGKAVKHDAQGASSLFEKDLGNGNKLFTFVTWAK